MASNLRVGDFHSQSLNHALRNIGGPQKSWMQTTVPGTHANANIPSQPAPQPAQPSAQAPKRRGRPPKHHAGQLVSLITSSTELQTGQPSSSNSTLPPLSHILNGLASASSPTTSEEHSHNARSLQNVGPVLPSTSASAGFTPINPPMHTRPHISSGEMTTNAHAHAASEGILQPITPSTSTAVPEPPPTHLNQHSHPSPIESTLLQQLQHHLQQQDQMNPASAVEAPLQHQGQTTDCFRWEEFRGVLQNFSMPKPNHPLNASDSSRNRVLMQAIETRDWQFLMTHQFYCMFDAQRESLPEPLSSSEGAFGAQQILQDVLAPNNCLSPTALAFFCQFPRPYAESYTRWPDNHNTAIFLYLQFGKSLAHYKYLQNECLNRQCPPIVWELARPLNISSLILQHVIAIHIIRCISLKLPGSPERERYIARAEQLFLQDQSGFMKRHSYLVEMGQLSYQQIQYDNDVYSNWWIPRYLSIFHAFMLRNESSSDSHPLSQLPTQNRGRQRRQTQHLAQQAVASRQRQGPRAPMQAAALQRPSDGQASATGRLLPPPNFSLSQLRVPEPDVHALHQSLLKSPILKTRSIEPPWYALVLGMLKEPARLTIAGHAVEKWSLSVADELFRNLIKKDDEVPGNTHRRMVSLKSRMARLRCIKWTSDRAPTRSEWAVADTSWIPYSYFTLNGESLQQRKKIHHGRDLPINVTDFLREGDNVLEISVLADGDDTSYQGYLLGIELVGFASHPRILTGCQKNRISAEDALQRIRKNLSTEDQDDEISVVGSSLIVKLFDPISLSNMCDTPVKGTTCLHPDCFDLETFLLARPRVGDVSAIDSWRCPICGADAHPQHLVVDGFIEQVQNELRAKGLGQTRAIIVDQNGEWKPKAEEQDAKGVSDESPTMPVAQPSAPAVIEIIDLSN